MSLHAAFTAAFAAAASSSIPETTESKRNSCPTRSLDRSHASAKPLVPSMMHKKAHRRKGDVANATWLPAIGYATKNCVAAKFVMNRRGNSSAVEKLLLTPGIRLNGRNANNQGCKPVIIVKYAP